MTIVVVFVAIDTMIEVVMVVEVVKVVEVVILYITNINSIQFLTALRRCYKRLCLSSVSPSICRDPVR